MAVPHPALGNAVGEEVFASGQVAVDELLGPADHCRIEDRAGEGGEGREVVLPPFAHPGGGTSATPR